MSKLSQGKDVSTEVLGKICAALDCTMDDILEFVPKEAEKQGTGFSQELFKTGKQR